MVSTWDVEGKINYISLEEERPAYCSDDTTEVDGPIKAWSIKFSGFRLQI